jgi:uncharacterized membrane protein HdeD (DUF308 family)
MISSNKIPVNYQWWLIMLKGLSSLLFGFIFITANGNSLSILMQLVGIYFMFSGIFSIIMIYTGQVIIRSELLMLNGIIGIISGVVAIRYSVIAAIITMPVMIGILGLTGIVQGAVSLVQGLAGVGMWMYVSGLISILMGIFILFNPLQQMIDLGGLLGFLTVITGIYLVVFAYEIKEIKTIAS